MSKTVTHDGFPDLLGNPINKGDYIIIVYGDFGELHIAKVMGWTKDFMKVKYLNKDHIFNKKLYSERFLKISPEEVTLYLLKNKGK